MVNAKIKILDPGADGLCRRYMASCERCGKRLWEIEHYPGTKAELRESSTQGSRYDRAEETWRPSKTHTIKFQTAMRRTFAGMATREDRDRLRAARGFSGQRLRGSLRSGWGDSDERWAALKLPTKIECPRCGAVNEVSLTTLNMV